ncbi:unnamed protein product [Adineta steineri]|uniref:Uncharacterized protein n=1 Tax=Adineta steineri TaxID=433720 RepID=A0A815EEC6_9BILA|nr:unnamed protein product [Adineta steineri]CAF3731551.1 unnamed protein product [Adineta steineri]
MTTKGAAKPAKPTAKTTLGKTAGKTVGKGDKQLTNVLEIVPGRFNETDWVSLLESDDTENFIADIFENIWKDASQQIQQIYLRRQLLSFTLMRTEHALSTVVQWAFLERDEPKPANGAFWIDDDEPIACSMDNWGEGVVPACREERPQDIEIISIPTPERSSSAPINKQISENLDELQRPSTGSTNSDKQTRQLHETDSIDQENNTEELSTKQPTRRLSFQRQASNHDILVIDTRPPKLEPLSDLFQRTSTAITPKRRRMNVPKLSSQFGSDTLHSMTNISEVTGATKTTKRSESKLFDEHHIEEMISKAPAAAHAMLKGILSRPPGYRELELNDEGNVVSMTKLDPDKFATRSVRLTCDIVKPRRSKREILSPSKQTRKMKLSRSDQKFTPVKIVMPEQSTEVADLIHPVPGVLYHDSKLKKGDPKRYQTGMARYINFHDEDRPLKPIAQSSDYALLRTANDLLRISKDYDNDNEVDSKIPKLHRLARIPPIMSASSTSST